MHTKWCLKPNSFQFCLENEFYKLLFPIFVHLGEGFLVILLCYELVQSFWVHCLFTGQFNTVDYGTLVVSIGRFPAFYVVPLEFLLCLLT